MEGLCILFSSQPQRNPLESKKSSSAGRKAKARTIAQLINSSSSWSPELEASLSSFHPLSVIVLQRALQAIKVPSRALEFFTHAHKKHGFPHFRRPYLVMLEILGRSRSLNQARTFLFSIEKRSNGVVKLDERFFNSLIRSYGEAGLAHEALNLFSLMKSMTISPSAFTFNNLLHIMVKDNKFTNAQRVFDEMLKTYGVAPDPYTFNILIKGFCKTNKVTRAFQMFNEMARYGCEPDVVTYNTIVDGLCREGKTEIAHNVIKGMIKKSRSNSNLAPNAITYTPLINGYCSNGMINEALSLFDEMNAQGVTPNEVSYNSLLKGVCDSNKLGMPEALEKAIHAGSFTPDTCTFNILIDSQCQAGNLVEVFRIFEKMKQMKAFPDSATYSTIIRALCDKEEYFKAEEVFDELLDRKVLLREDGCVPFAGAYTPILNFLCKNEKTGKAERLLRLLMRRSNLVSQCFDIVIMGHCREGGFKAAYDVLISMSRRRFKAEMNTYEVLINGLVKKQEALLAYKALEKMAKISYVAKSATFYNVLKVLARTKRVNELGRVIEMMLEREVPLNMRLSSVSVKMLFGHGMHAKAFKVVHNVYEKGFKISMDMVIGFLITRNMILNSYNMILTCFKYNEKVDVEQCDAVIRSLCGMGKHSEAFQLFYELVERKLHHRLTCLRCLEGALQSVGRFREAQFVSKRMNPSLIVASRDEPNKKFR